MPAANSYARKARRCASASARWLWAARTCGATVTPLTLASLPATAAGIKADKVLNRLLALQSFDGDARSIAQGILSK